MEALFIYLLKSAGILTIFFLTYKFLLQKETFFSLNRHYLLGGIIASLLLPLVVFNTYIYVEPVVETSLYNIPVTYIDSAEVALNPFDWNALLFNIYIMGVIFISSQFVIQLFSLYRIVKCGTVKQYGSYKLIEVSKDVSPFSFFNYIIYNPKNFSEKDLNVILNHEKAHSRQLHSVDIIISQLFVIFQWFNPIVWLYKKNIQQNLEFMADKAAISNLDSIRNYQHTLLKVSVPIYCTSITNNFYNSLIKKRIVMLNQTSSKTRNLWKYSLILPALALFLMSFNTKTVEIVKESEIALTEIPGSNNLLPIEHSIIAPVKKNETATSPKKEVRPTLAYKSKEINDVIVKITKNTTKEELDKIEKDLGKRGIEFSYSSLDFNSNGEITNIKLKYKDKEFGNSGSYHVNSDDDEPIKTIYIYTKDNGAFGIGSSPDGKEHREHMRAHAEKMEEHKARMHEHKERMKEHNATVKEEHEEHMEEHRARMEEHKVEMKERMEERKAHMEELKTHMEERKAQMEERKVRLQKRKAEMKEEREELKVKGQKGNSFVYVTDKDDDSNTFVYATGSSSNNSGKIKINADGKTPLYVVNGKIIDGDDISHIKPDNISSINVLKGKSAIEVYGEDGEDGEDGVIQIYTKGQTGSKKSKKVHITHNTSSDFEKAYFIENTTSDRLLNSYKEKLKNQGIDFKFSGVKRNKNGEITRIKLRLDNNKGSKTSSSYDTSPDAIPTIVIGRKDGKYVINSSN